MANAKADINDIDDDVELCCLKSCIVDAKNKSIPNGSGKVEVKTFESKRKKGQYIVAWEGDGLARFHTKCWEALLKATKGDSSFSENFSDIERSMVLEANKTAEHHDSEATVSDEALRIASILKNSKYCIAFTGAGISTAAGISDFRGKDGQWTKRDREKNYGTSSKSKAPNKATVMSQLRPTYTHEAICKLVDMGLIKFLISQNTDGLHRLSGVPVDKLAELHGNSFQERCEDCGALYELKHHFRQGKTTIAAQSSAMMKKCTRCKLLHRTGRKCSKTGCDGYLNNTIINFGDYLESDVIGTAEHNARMADAVLAMGSTLRVSPANHLVTAGKAPHRLIICNRQSTPYDTKCKEQGDEGQLGSRVFCDCDKLMRKVMEQILMTSQLETWENEKDTRMASYDTQRITV